MAKAAASAASTEDGVTVLPFAGKSYSYVHSHTSDMDRVR